MTLWTEYQNLIVGSIGFAGVIFTLWFTVAEHSERLNKIAEAIRGKQAA